MSTASKVVNRAYRKSNLTDINSGGPTELELTEGLESLNDILSVLFGYHIGRELTSWILKTAKSDDRRRTLNEPSTRQFEIDTEEWIRPPSNARVYNSVSSETTVFMPYNPQDGAMMSFVNTRSVSDLTIDGNGTMVNGSEQYLFTSMDAPITFFFRQDLGNWIILDDLAIDDELPLPREFDNFLSSYLAIELLDRNGTEARSGTSLGYTDGLSRLKSRYHQRVQVNSQEKLTLTGDDTRSRNSGLGTGQW